MTQLRISLISSALFAVVLVFGLLFVQTYERGQLAQQRRAVSQIADSYGQALQRQMDRALSATLAMASLVRQFKDIQDFEIVAADILESYGGLNQLALAPGGVIAAVYPVQENDPELGRDLLQDPVLGFQAQTAVDTGDLTVTAPLDAEAGQTVMVGQLPVYLPDDVGRERFWGFAVAVVDVQGVIAASNLDGLALQGYDHKLTFGLPSLTNPLSASSGFEHSGAIAHSVEMPNGVWTLSINANNLGTNWATVAIEISLVVIFSGLVASLAYALLRQPLVLRREVAVRTEELSFANAQLANQIEERVRAEEKYRDLFENANDAIYTLDRIGCYTSFNHRAELLTGYSKDEILGQPYHLPVLPGDRSEARRAFMMNLKGKVHTFELNLLTKQKTQLVVEISARPIERDGKIVGVQGIARDITERKALEQMKDDFVSTVSHELRTPLTSIKGYAELLLLEKDDTLSDQQKEFLNILLKNCKRLMGLINDLLDMAKLDAGQLQFSMQRLNINDVLQEVLQNFQLRAQEKGILLQTELQDNLYVKGDFERLVQVFSNLVSNAIKYTEQGHVIISNTVHNGSVQIQVKDSGVGVSQEDLEQLFQKFFRSSEAYTQTVSGTGLGLAISKTIVEHHLGNIEVDSHFGEGSTFTVSLPRAS